MIKAHLFEEDFGSRFAIVFFEDLGTERKIYNLVTGEVKILKENDSYPEDFVLRIPSKLLESLNQAISDKGIKTENDHYLTGVLEATKIHLKDMRNLVFENRKSKVENG